MKLYSLVLLVSLITFCKAYVQLTDDNFSDLVQKQDEWILKFYAEWCGYCKQFEPKFQTADRYIGMSTHKHVKLGAINIDNNPGLSARFFISRLPTLVHIKNHEVRIMPHPKSENDIVAFVTLEQWQDVNPRTGVPSPFGLFGKIIGLTGVMMREISTYSPITLMVLFFGFIFLTVGLPVMLTNKYIDKEQPDEKKVEDREANDVASLAISSATKKSSQSRKKK